MKPAIVGIAGPVLSAAEAAGLARHAPAGVILFGRNIQDPPQLARLMAALRAVLPPAADIMVDQEGGRVARLRPPHWRAHPPARAIGALYAHDHVHGQRAAWLTGALIGAQCAQAGFTLVAAPVLDVGGAHDVIGDRAFAADPETVAVLGRAVAEGLMAAGVQPIAKHAPGHGRARADSHLELPVLDDIADSDLVPFARNADLPWMMTAHIRYTAQDMHDPATQSQPIISRVIRGRIGFQGVLITDDLAMQALSGTPGERAARALAAGCDIALHCSGVLADTEDVLNAVPDIAPHQMLRSTPRPMDVQALAAERDRLMA
jgi:beta-N-acetylhexosaminidase